MWRAVAVVMAAVVAAVIIIAAVVIRSPAPPKPRPRPRINIIHIRINVRIIIRRHVGPQRSLVDGIDQGIEDRGTDAGVMERDNLVRRQRVARAGVLNLVDDDVITDMGLHHGLDFRQRRAGWWRGDGAFGRGTTGPTEARQRQKEFQFHIATYRKRV